MRSISLTLDAVSCVSKMLRSIVSNMDLTDIKKNPQCDLSIIDNITDLTDKTKPQSIWFELPYLKSDCSYDIRLHDSAMFGQKLVSFWEEHLLLNEDLSVRDELNFLADPVSVSCAARILLILIRFLIAYHLSCMASLNKLLFCQLSLEKKRKFIDWLIDWGPWIVAIQPMRASYVHVSFNSSETVPIIHNMKGCKWLVSCCQENFL